MRQRSSERFECCEIFVGKEKHRRMDASDLVRGEREPSEIRKQHNSRLDSLHTIVVERHVRDCLHQVENARDAAELVVAHIDQLYLLQLTKLRRNLSPREVSAQSTNL